MAIGAEVVRCFPFKALNFEGLRLVAPGFARNWKLCLRSLLLESDRVRVGLGCLRRVYFQAFKGRGQFLLISPLDHGLRLLGSQLLTASEGAEEINNNHS
jgi:hypothetical protein